MKNIFFAVFFYTSIFFCYSQSSFSNYNLETEKKLVGKLDYQLEYQIRIINSKFKTEIKKVYKQRHEQYIESLNDSIFLRNEAVETYLNTILKNIYNSNPQINSHDFIFFLNKSIAPNASCYGDKNFSINIGLLSILKNEDEIAYILCHEIAHYQLNHVNNKIKDYFETINNKDTKQKVKEIKRTKYRKTRAGMKFLKGLTFNSLKHSREVEKEADSLGIELLKNTDYNAYAAVTTLLKLDSIEDQVFQKKINIDRTFDFDEYPFKKRWLKKEESLFSLDSVVNDFQWNKDSLKSHPAAKLRADILAKKTKNNNQFTNTHHNKIVEQLNLDIIDLNIKNNQFDIALYLSLVGLDDKLKNRDFYITKIAEIFAKLYIVQKEHSLGKYVKPISHISKEKHLVEIRQFLHNLELKHIRKIGYYFCLRHKDNMNSNNEFQSAFNTLKKLNLK